MNSKSLTLETQQQSRPAHSSKDLVASGYSGAVLSSHAEIRQLGEATKRFPQQDGSAFTPNFFLASMSKGWRPKVVVVYYSGEVVGILYTKERVISGIPTGVLYADGSLSAIMVGNPQHYGNAFRVAVETLLASRMVMGIRLRVPSNSSELHASREMSASGSVARYHVIDYRDSPVWKYHAHLPLAASYDQFLSGLGATTRRNFRHYRRRSEAAGHIFVERLSMDELRTAAHDLVPKSEFTARWQKTELEVPLDMVAAAIRPLAIGLRHQSGEWLGVIGGWHRPNGAVLCIQLNNQRNFGDESLSLVLRGYLIEQLIQQGLQELVIWSETGPPLSRYVSYIPTMGVRFDVATYSWRAAQLFISKIKPLLPARLAEAAQWFA